MKVLEYNKSKILPEISIISVTYNSFEFLHKLLDSIYKQDIINRCELIISDDASTDGTANLLKELMINSPCYSKIILRKKNVGAVENWVKTLDHARGKFIAYIDGDDYFNSSRKLSNDLDTINQEANNNFVFSPAYKFKANKITSESRNKYKNWNPKDIDLRWVLTTGGGFYPTSSIFFKKSLLSNLPKWFLTTHCTGDLPLAAAAILNGGRICYRPGAETIYRVHDKSMTHNRHSVFITFRSNLRKKYQNCEYYRLLATNGYIDDALSKELINKEEYIFFSKLLDVGAYDYCLKHSIKKLSIKYLARLYLKFIWILTNKLFNNLYKYFKRSNKSD